MTITVSSLGHSTIVLTKGEARFVIDPGIFAPADSLTGASAVFITHDHADHLNAPAIAAAMAADANLRVWGSATAIAIVKEQGADEARLTVVNNGDKLDVEGVSVEVFGEHHAPIHSALPASENSAFLFDGEVLHTGDAFPEIREGVSLRVLLLPIAAPWLRLEDAINYSVKLKAQFVVPIHDGILSDAGKMLTDRVMGAIPSGSEYRRLAPGESL